MIDFFRYIYRLCFGKLEHHPEINGWKKCNSCAYSRVEKELITLEQYLMGRDKDYPLEYDEKAKQNAQTLLDKVNALLKEFNITDAKITSGFRPQAINAAVPNAAKKSAHSTCEAVDILDNQTQDLAKKILDNKEILERFDLYLESPEHTKGKNANWIHLQTRKTKSGNRVFIP